MLIFHHTKYKEIHGIDEVKVMDRPDHSKLHHRLRTEGRCNVPPDELEKISRKAHTRRYRKKDNTIYSRNLTAVQVRPRTLKKMITLAIYANKRKDNDITVDIVMKVLNVSRRTAYDYLMTFQYIRNRPA